MAKYIVQEMNDLNKTGKKQAYTRMETFGNLSKDEFIDRITYAGSGFSKAQVVGVMEHAAKWLAYYMGLGYTVTLDGIGTFHAKVGTEKGKVPEGLDDGDDRRNAQSLHISGVGFRPSRKLITETDSHCSLERGGVRRINTSPHSPEERLKMAQDYLDQHGVMRVKDYASMTSLPHTSATKELNGFCKDPNTGICSQGKRCTKIFVKKVL